MENKELAGKIVKLIGGTENISQSWHCITRLRFNLNDESQVKVDELKTLDGVLGAQFQSGQFQVIIGAKVAEVYEEIDHLAGHSSNDSAPVKNTSKMNPIEVVFDVISGIFTPILPAIVGSGLIKGIMALFVSLGWLTETSSTYQVLQIFSNAVFYFLPFLIAYSAAKKFKTRESLALALAGILLYPTMIEGAAKGADPLSFLGLSIPLNNYTSSVLPIILGVLLLSFVDKWITKAIPKSLSIVFTPVLSLMITAPLTLAFIAPIGNVSGHYLEIFFTSLFNFAGPIAGLLMGGLMPLIVLTGMHYAFFPSTLASFEKVGYDIMLLPMNFIANMAQAGAVLGVIIRTKRVETRSLALSTLLPSFFGITEPAIYGVTLRLKKPFYASLIGGAVGGCFYGLFSVKTTAFSIPGITSLPTYIMKGTNNFQLALIGIALSFIVSLLITILLGFQESVTAANEQAAEKRNHTESTENQQMSKQTNPYEVQAPMSGKVIPLSEVNDSVFSSEMMGKGVAILPDKGVVQAPFSGKVVTVTPTKHAIGLVSDDGIELLIHVGIDTVSLNGQFFDVLVKEGDEMKTGDHLLSFDIEGIQSNHLDVVTPIIVTNSTQYLDVIHTGDAHVTAGQNKLLMLIH
ncbi:MULTISPECIES: beta-glucoside-specific PTS transporter subunit IIABC [Bacillus]|uniref:beta-glucoside-specific PTS transporter subunit IIABC n=1 Tax=Bacillus TaxID=1386 RepID=UPI000E2F443A|nr:MULTISPECIES: beta-glucoside-specific PTS transporter subunit IIABC [Bacillus]MCA1017715.1 beta-glucoside-specific PTS transporter subunit IIABC [Bacillus stratosphericus]MCY7497879.1 beta-glucoside-specific PTS transporter subunit IIABC [Bacillus altitudinis]MCY7536878.1 beta-glucoside-specific PTS transporter subunit IIABC [Bacillus altitudinis]MCY7547987.1 beta-glucoside-specific PTS transporter subunit IIABC [Bacillus altitudinis]MCY7556001.1 beta-glucoside-specific PTS transporter subu